MLRRFRLEQKSSYEKLVIAQRLADMLEKFLRGRPAPLEIGAEKGEIEEWDDVVIMHAIDHFEHLQIKRQTTNFCTKNPNKANQRPRKRKNESTDKTPNNSVLDKAFSSLANYSSLGKLDEAPRRVFKLSLVGAHLHIKDKLTVNHLDEVCKLCRQDGLNLKELADRNDGPTQNVYLWLTTWCGFKDWKHVKDVLCRVHIHCVGNDEILKSQTLDSLSRYFTDAERTMDRLMAYITSETSDVSALRCQSILRVLQDELRPDIETWAQYQLTDGTAESSKSWTLSGTHNLSITIPSSAQGVVDHMWSNKPGDRKLRVYADISGPLGENLSLQSAIMRMALHLPSGSKGLILGESKWRSTVGHEIGHTLGCSEDDFSEVAWLENPERLDCVQDFEFRTQTEARKEAEQLAKAMDDILWRRLLGGVSEKLCSIKDIDLADAMENTWRTWQAGFNAAPDSRRRFMEQLLYPKTERKNGKQGLRLGLRTLSLLITAVETLLLVAVGFPSSSNSWDSFVGGGAVLSIALKYWSGPVDGFSEVRELSDDPLINIIGPNPDPIVILSGVSTSPSELLNLGMADDAETATSMAAERQPLLLVTRSGMYQHLRKGTLNSVRQYFIEQLQGRQHARDIAIEKTTTGI